MKKAGTTINDYDLIEANEAFAVQALADGRALGWDWARVNVHGGAVALGHPDRRLAAPVCSPPCSTPCRTAASGPVSQPSASAAATPWRSAWRRM